MDAEKMYNNSEAEGGRELNSSKVLAGLGW